MDIQVLKKDLYAMQERKSFDLKFFNLNDGLLTENCFSGKATKSDKSKNSKLIYF